jgi:hypothetical protein
LWIIGLVVLGLAARVAFYTSRFGRHDGGAHDQTEEVGPFTIYHDGAASQGTGALQPPVREIRTG